jgi:hypothetical protein
MCLACCGRVGYFDVKRSRRRGFGRGACVRRRMWDARRMEMVFGFEDARKGREERRVNV